MSLHIFLRAETIDLSWDILTFFFFIIIFFFSLYLLFSPSYIYMISALHLSPHIDPSPWSVHLTFHRDISIMLVSSFHWPEFSHECSGESGRAWMAEKTGAVSTGSILLSERCYICDYISQLCLLLNVYHPAKPVLIQGPPKLRRVLQRQAGMDTVGMLWFFFSFFTYKFIHSSHTFRFPFLHWLVPILITYLETSPHPSMCIVDCDGLFIPNSHMEKLLSLIKYLKLTFYTLLHKIHVRPFCTVEVAGSGTGNTTQCTYLHCCSHHSHHNFSDV